MPLPPSPSPSAAPEPPAPAEHARHPLRARRWWSPRAWHKRLLLVGAALLAGTISILFAMGADHAIRLHHELMTISPWITLVVAPAGFAAMAWLSRRFFPGTEGSGIPQAIAASLADEAKVRHQFLSFRIVIGKVFLTLGGLLAGASIGREGPSVQIGASTMHLLDRFRGVRVASSVDLIAAGAGAGIAAAFNTPLGGIMFAIEEMCRHRTFRANSTTLIAVIFAGLISMALMGNYTYFGHTPAMMSLVDGIWPVLVIGVVGGFVGGGFSRLLIVSARGLPGKLGAFATTRPLAFAAGCGLATALLGLISGGLTYGTGYAEARDALEGSVPLPLYFLFFKMAVIWLAFVARIPGGIFAPALAVGTGLGTDIAWVLTGSDDAAMMVLGMVGFLAAMTQAPITSFVIVMEMTDNHQMLIPLMATAVIAHGISKAVSPLPLYHALAYPMLKKAKAQFRQNNAAAANAATEPLSPR